jgi:pimeloyl-ACP methyl ester carboxylesterase
MATEMLADDRATALAQEGYTLASATSRDGTPIGYRQLGHGPGVVLLHGAMESAASHLQLAEALADAFTVYLPDRRGRGTSGASGAGNGAQQNSEDLDAILTQTGTRDVFGVSSGAIICLQAALALPTIRRVAIYEPPFFVSDLATPTALLARYDKEIAAGNVTAALVTGMLGAQMGPPIFNVMPRWLLEALTNMAMNAEEKRAKPSDVTMRMLAPTLHDDFALVVAGSTALDSLRAIPVEVLLLGGSKSPAYLKSALDALEHMLPRASRVEFPGLGHGGSGNANRGGQPAQVAQELRRFFAD